VGYGGCLRATRPRSWRRWWRGGWLAQGCSRRLELDRASDGIGRCTCTLNSWNMVKSSPYVETYPTGSVTSVYMLPISSS
jgi:hypothetical protein